MKSEKTERGFVIVYHPSYGCDVQEDIRLFQESSAIGDYDNSFDNPGGSFLWIGKDHHLNREEVVDMIKRMQFWLDTGRLEVD